MAKRPRQKSQKSKNLAKTSAKGRKQRAAKRQAKRAAKRSVKRQAQRSAKRPTKRAKQAKRPETLRTPPSSLDMNRTPSAARSGRKAQDENLRRHADMGALSGGDADADMEGAYFSGDEAPGGDNPTPDQQDVEEMGHALGVDYQDAEELKGSPKVEARDKHRWELDPASSDDYKDRSK